MRAVRADRLPWGGKRFTAEEPRLTLRARQSMVRDYPKSFAVLRARRLHCGNRHRSIWVLAVIARCVLLGVAASLPSVSVIRAAESGTILGLPFSRFYSFEEIGNASRGARLGFDSLGRLAITHQGSYVVLNDNTWIDIADKKATGPKIQQVVFDPEGRAYYGAIPRSPTNSCSRKREAVASTSILLATRSRAAGARPTIPISWRTGNGTSMAGTRQCSGGELIRFRIFSGGWKTVSSTA